MESRSAPPSPDESGGAVFNSRCLQYPHQPSLQRTFASCRESTRPRPHHRHAVSEPARPDERVFTTAEVHDYPSSESGIAADCPHAHSSNADDSPCYDRSDYEGNSSYSLRHNFHHATDCNKHRSEYHRSHTPDYHEHGSDSDRGHPRSQTSRRPHRKHKREDDDGAQSLDERCARDLDEILPARLAGINLLRDQPSQSWNRSNIAATMERFEPVDYSYAYYDHHLSMPSSSRKVNRQRGRGLPRERSARHNYVTRYGTEENIYEEITDGSRTCPKHRHAPRQSLISLDRSVVEEEVRRVESRHKRILGELNLSVEAMLMPECESPDSERAEDRDNIEELLRVGPTDELLSPASCNPPDLDSGFSGSSSGASYVLMIVSYVALEKFRHLEVPAAEMLNRQASGIKKLGKRYPAFQVQIASTKRVLRVCSLGTLSGVSPGRRARKASEDLSPSNATRASPNDVSRSMMKPVGQAELNPELLLYRTATQTENWWCRWIP
ncbi:unnamed protein product [Leptosia nina]|uniref:Uncharacterized protein n=1 Tax=Leptosia nina TaxID=320188 RepID=A0AAV1K7Y5_9NEOP